MPLLTVLVVFVLVWLAFGRNEHSKDRDTSAEWRRAEVTSVGADKFFLAAARPLSNVPAIYERAISPQYRWLQSKLLASGGSWGNSVEVFLSVQVVAIVIAVMMLAALATFDTTTFQKASVGLGAFGVLGWPYTQVSKRAKTRIEEVNDTLPIFTDLLQMPLAAGMGVLPAISFTLERMPAGHVHTELSHMLALQKSRSVTDAEAFMMAGERLGTPEAKAFFTALMQAHTQGMTLAANLEKQAEALRDKAFEQRREKIMRLPTKVSIITAMHLMPLVLVVTMLPLVLSLGNL
jgi:tight adherence protein C